MDVFSEGWKFVGKGGGGKGDWEEIKERNGENMGG